MNFKIDSLPDRELRAELHYYEGEFGMSSEAFARAYAAGKAGEILEEIALEWVMAYEAWQLVTASAPQTPPLKR